MGLLDYKHFLRVVVQVLAQFVAQVGVRVAVADDFARSRYADGTVIGGYENLAISLRQMLQHLSHRRVAEPRECDRTVGRLVVGELAHHLRLRAGMRQHVDEVEHQHVQVVLPE